jgi:tetratricopeptide (TPR) repeat protein
MKRFWVLGTWSAPFILATSAWVLTYGAAPQFDAERLRSLAKLPMINLGSGFGAETELGFTLAGEPLDPNLRTSERKLSWLEGQLKTGPRNAEALIELGTLQQRTGATNEAQRNLAKATVILREEIQNAPTNGWLRAQLGRTLLLQGSVESGEELLEGATAMSPKDWRCWNALAASSFADATQILSPTNAEVTTHEDLARVRSTARPDLSTEQRAQALKHYQQAKRCYDQAVAAAPEKVEPRKERMLFLLHSSQTLEPALYPDERPGGSDRAAPMPPAALADLIKAASLTTNDVYAIGMAALFTAMSDLARQNPQLMVAPDRWSALSDSAKAYVRASMTRLEGFAGCGNPLTEAGSAAALGVLQFMVMGDTANAEENLRRAERLDPTAQKPWESLYMILAITGRWDAVIQLCLDRLKDSPSAWLHFLTAKAYQQQGNWSETRRHLLAGLTLEKGHLACRLGLAALDLRRHDPESLQEAERIFADLVKSGMWSAPPEQVIEFEYLHGIYFGLAGNREEAIHHFRRLMEVQRQNERFKEAYDAVGRY